MPLLVKQFSYASGSIILYGYTPTIVLALAKHNVPLYAILLILGISAGFGLLIMYLGNGSNPSKKHYFVSGVFLFALLIIGLVSFLDFLSSGSAVAPFIYTLF